MPAELRAGFERQVGASLADVRIHTDAAAAEAADGVDAAAFTIGREIYFGRNRWEPQSTGGRRLIAHEIVHSVQQRRAAETDATSPARECADESVEREACLGGERLARGESFRPRYHSGLAIARQTAAPEVPATEGAVPEFDPFVAEQERSVRLGAESLVEAREGVLEALRRRDSVDLLNRTRALTDAQREALRLDDAFLGELRAGLSRRGVWIIRRILQFGVTAPPAMRAIDRAVHDDDIVRVSALLREHPELADPSADIRPMLAEVFAGNRLREALLATFDQVRLEQTTWAVPPSARVTPANPNVPGDQREQFDALRAFVASLPARVEPLVLRGDPRAPWLTPDNPNVRTTLRLLRLLVRDLESESLAIRFEPREGAAAASYRSVDNEVSIPPSDTDAGRATVAVSLLHEYAHVMQDRLTEAQLAPGPPRPYLTREADLQREVDARRVQAYLAGMLDLLGVEMAGYGAARNFIPDFEGVRAATTDAGREAASRSIANSLASDYAAQLTRAESIRQFIVELDTSNHAWLHTGSGPGGRRDLGPLDRSMDTTNALRGVLGFRIQQQADYAGLFRDAERNYRLAVFTVIFNGRRIVEFGMEAP